MVAITLYPLHTGRLNQVMLLKTFVHFQNKNNPYFADQLHPTL